MLRKFAIALVLLVPLFRAAVAKPAVPRADEAAVYCRYVDNANRAVYYTDAFMGDWMHEPYKSAFSDYIDSHFDHPKGMVDCSMASMDHTSLREARSARDANAADYKRMNYKVEFTNWTY